MALHGKTNHSTFDVQSSTFDVQSIAIIGGGAAGYFTAITAAEANPQAMVTIYEMGRRTLTKVKISGGVLRNARSFDEALPETFWEIVKNLLPNGGAPPPSARSFLNCACSSFSVIVPSQLTKISKW